MATTRIDYINQAKSWLGCKESDGSHKKIIDVYNSQKKLPRGYKVKYTDSWCATFVSACAIKTNNTDIIPTECSCNQMITLFKNAGIWMENDAYIPNTGDIIFYDWQDSGKGDNVGTSEHVGIVESVSNGKITVIEGNKNDSVSRRVIDVNGRYIRGFGIPKFVGQEVKPESSGDTQKTSNYVVNKIYSLCANLYIRSNPGGSKKAYKNITANAKKNVYVDSNGNAILKNGTKVTCLGTIKVGNNIWMKIPSGYVCAKAGSKVYIK